ncbi:MAG: M48 family peptidase [Firmicutes bacterium HGW-Firmicutes-21]|nr:MAG: M48 family peptidase [Firmicutes bacterium HGW-Firmicutes-21]
MQSLSYTVIRSTRKSISLEITSELQILVRVPRQMRKSEIESFLDKHRSWIEKHMELRKKKNRDARVITEEQAIEFKRSAKEYLPKRTEHFAELLGLTPTSIKITSAKKRFGSCSAKNGICYSWRLMVYPREIIDYVIVHELAHIKYKNHGVAFYAFIEKHMPDYKQRVKMLKTANNVYEGE